MKKMQFILMLCAAIVTASCDKPVDYGNVSVGIDYSINGNHLITDSLCYHNEVGNAFMITEIQWFISNMELQNEQGEWIPLEHREVDNLLSNPTDKIFYIDTNIPESQTLLMAPIPIGHYKAMRFTFGLDEDDNLSGLFSDMPESNMFWPEPLGGGYHYMKLNGRFVNADDELIPLNIHLGIGQNANHTEFYQNYFIVEGPINLDILENKENLILLEMVVDNWFRNPNLYNFNEFGSAIMQNQAAQQALKENGQDVFTWAVFEESNEKDMKKEEIFKKLRHIMQGAAPKPHYWSWENVKKRYGIDKSQDESDK